MRRLSALQQHVQRPENKRKKKFSSVSRTSILAKPKEHIEHRVILRDPTKVKQGALLYEISERTNALAKPRIPRISTSLRELNRSFDLVKIPKASPRLLELSRPKVFYGLPPRAIGYVERSALTAVATPRLIELSKPRKRRKPRSPKKRRLRCISCSARIMHLARPKCTLGKRTVHKFYEKSGNSEERQRRLRARKCRPDSGKPRKRKRSCKKECIRAIDVTDSTRSVILVETISKTRNNRKKRSNLKKRHFKIIPSTRKLRRNEYGALNTYRK